ncbi:MAG: thioesterase family protein, partial [Chloroflexota bacterium]
VFHGDRVSAETRATSLGRSSFVLEHRLTACAPGEAPRLVATSESVMVRYDYATERPIPLGPAFVAAIERFEGTSLRRP